MKNKFMMRVSLDEKNEEKVVAQHSCLGQVAQAELNKICGFDNTLSELMLGLMSEVGEVADVVAKMKGNKTTKSGDNLADLDAQLQAECADVLVYLYQIANLQGFGLFGAYSDKAEVLINRHGGKK